VAGMPDRGAMPHARAGLPGHGCQPSIGGEGFHRVTRRKVEGGHARPRRRHPAHACDTLPALRGRSPCGALAACGRDVRFRLGELPLEGG
jgi:hypothetical protein